MFEYLTQFRKDESLEKHVKSRNQQFDKVTELHKKNKGSAAKY